MNRKRNGRIEVQREWTITEKQETTAGFSERTPDVTAVIICVFAICGNTLSLTILLRNELKGSIYVYLSVLSSMDLCASMILFLSGLSKGIFWTDKWPVYDLLVGLPLAGIFNSISVLATLLVTLDRIIYLWNPLKCQKPKFCSVKVAKRLMMLGIVILFVFNLPSFFIFKLNKDQKVVPTKLFYTRLYSMYNWTKFMLFGILPTILLILGNSFLVIFLRKVCRMKAKCGTLAKCQNDLNCATLALIAIVFFFLITEIPSLLVSRTSAVTFFFGGDKKCECNSKDLEILRQISDLTNAIGLTVDFLLYYFLCPTIHRAMVKIFKKQQSLQVNVFLLNSKQDHVQREKGKFLEENTNKCTNSNLKSSFENQINKQTTVTIFS